MKKQQQYHRNKCQKCFRNKGRFIFDCYCIFCQNCFQIKQRNGQVCQFCRKQTKGAFIDTRNEASVNKFSYLFGNIETNIGRLMEIYKFQLGLDMRYCKFLQNQIDKYKGAIKELIDMNPQLAAYFDSKLANKSKHHNRSVSERIPTPHQPQNQNRYVDRPSTPTNQLNSSRSISNISNMQMQHQRVVDPQRVHQQGDRNYSGKVAYKVPNINYNTAMKSSKRPNMRNEQDQFEYYQRNKHQ